MRTKLDLRKEKNYASIPKRLCCKQNTQKKSQEFRKNSFKVNLVHVLFSKVLNWTSIPKPWDDIHPKHQSSTDQLIKGYPTKKVKQVDSSSWHLVLFFHCFFLQHVHDGRWNLTMERKWKMKKLLTRWIGKRLQDVGILARKRHIVESNALTFLS